MEVPLSHPFLVKDKGKVTDPFMILILIPDVPTSFGSKPLKNENIKIRQIELLCQNVNKLSRFFLSFVTFTVFDI